MLQPPISHLGRLVNDHDTHSTILVALRGTPFLDEPLNIAKPTSSGLQPRVCVCKAASYTHPQIGAQEMWFVKVHHVLKICQPCPSTCFQAFTHRAIRNGYLVVSNMCLLSISEQFHSKLVFQLDYQCFYANKSYLYLYIWNWVTLTNHHVSYTIAF